jgi:hypothetical protein
MKRNHAVLSVAAASLALFSGFGLAQGEAYVLRVVEFLSGDESGIDRSGSDEIYWIFTALDPSGTTHTTRSQEWGSIDSGDTREFPTENDQDIVWPAPGAAEGAPGPIELFVQVWEADIAGEAERALERTRDAFEVLEWVPGVGQFAEKAPDVFRNAIGRIIGDDSMGTRTIAWPTDELARRLPEVGNSLTEPYHFKEPNDPVGSGPADYHLTIKITRVQ